MGAKNGLMPHICIIIPLGSLDRDCNGPLVCDRVPELLIDLSYFSFQEYSSILNGSDTNGPCPSHRQCNKELTILCEWMAKLDSHYQFVSTCLYNRLISRSLQLKIHPTLCAEVTLSGAHHMS